MGLRSKATVRPGVVICRFCVRTPSGSARDHQCKWTARLVGAWDPAPTGTPSTNFHFLISPNGFHSKIWYACIALPMGLWRLQNMTFWVSNRAVSFFDEVLFFMFAVLCSQKVFENQHYLRMVFSAGGAFVLVFSAGCVLVRMFSGFRAFLVLMFSSAEFWCCFGCVVVIMFNLWSFAPHHS